MSGTGLVQQIAEVLRGELVVKDGEWAWRDAGLDYVDQLAERVVARLNLHEERRYSHVCTEPGKSAADCDTPQRRWVSGWVPTPTDGVNVPQEPNEGPLRAVESKGAPR